MKKFNKINSGKYSELEKILLGNTNTLGEYIKTKTIAGWKEQKPDLPKAVLCVPDK